MKHIADESRHHAEAALTRINEDLRDPRVANDAKTVAMLMRAKRDAWEAIEAHDRKYGNDRNYRNDRNDWDDRNNYSDGYTSRAMDVITDAMDAINRILPHVTGEMEGMDVVDRQGVPGTGPYSRKRRRAGGGRRKVRVGGYTRRLPRMEADDGTGYDEGYQDAMDDLDDVEDRRRRDRYGRFMDGDDIPRTAATAAAETARRMNGDRGDVYPYQPTPVMPRQDMDAADDKAYRYPRADRAAGVGPGATTRG